MDKRFQVYISGALNALPEERREVLNAVLELDCIPTGIGILPPERESHWGLVEKAIGDCDYHLLLQSGDPGADGAVDFGFAEREFRHALALEKPSIVFLRRESAGPSGGPEASATGPEPRQGAHRDGAAGRMIVEWSSPRELGLLVSRSLLQLIKSTRAVGWIRAEEATGRETTLEILRLRRRIEELEQELALARTSPPRGSERLAQGGERHTLRYSFESQSPAETGAARWNGSFQASWNEIFAAVAPLMLRESGEAAIRAAIDLFVQARNMRFLRKKRKLHDSRLGNFALHNEDFETVMIQLRALGLIVPAVARESAPDAGPRWGLTPFGETVMTRLRAIPSSAGSKRGGFEASEEVEEEVRAARDVALSDRFAGSRFEPGIAEDGRLGGRSA
jgi:hypothetical protein